ncbi:MAG: hypothetical protein IJH86_05995 [Clostridia bacterium]|nr:hypothetical protein [Clostridia bacterium]
MKKLIALVLIAVLTLCCVPAIAEAADADAALIGDWQTEDQFSQMTIEKNPAGEDWDVEIASPLTHGAYIFKTTIRYDEDRHCFTYNKGKFWDVPITDSEEVAELGEAKVAGTIGTFTFTGDPEDPVLTWEDDSRPGEAVVFYKAQDDTQSGSDYTYFPEIEAYVGQWQSGDYRLEIVHMLDDYNLLNCIVTRMDDKYNGVRWIYDACSYDDVGKALASMEIGMKFTILLDDNGDLVSNEEIFTDGAAAFALNDDGTLTWTDFKEAPGEDEIVFERAEG